MKLKMITTICAVGACLVLLGVVAPASAHQGTVVKYSQLPGYIAEPNNPDVSGENIPSDTDWNRPSFALPATAPNWVVADDFQDPFNTPVFTVRWWGSYFGETFETDATGVTIPIFGPGSEDGYIVSFFSDMPASTDAAGNIIPSRPDELLATYVANFDVVRVTPTSAIGWDMHEIFQYEVNLQDTHLEHAVPGLADQNGFNQKAGEIYWVSIMAEVGHELVMTPDGLWVEQDTGKFAQPSPNNPEGHFWGWHTSPEHFNDDASMGHLLMGPAGTNEWIYPIDAWRPIQAQHGLNDMAFELLTIPEPASGLLLLLGAVGFAVQRRRR